MPFAVMWANRMPRRVLPVRRADLPVIDQVDGRLRQMSMQAMQTHRFRLRRATQDDLRWLAATLRRESAKLGTRVDLDRDKLRVTGDADVSWTTPMS